MTTLFADSFYFLALANPRDPAHQAATVWAAGMPRVRLVTTTHVLTEVADGLCGSRNRAKAVALIRDPFASTWVTVIFVDAELFDAGLSLYESRPDKDWSLTDCISFVVMEREGLADALTGDRHFRQAGFRPFMAP